MGLFSFLNRNNANTPDRQEVLNVSTNNHAYNEIPENIFIQNDPILEGLTVNENPSSAIDNNINILFAFLDRNHESKGYDDALINPDINHLNQNLEALKNELIRVINKVKTFYEDFIKEINYHIDSRGRNGMVDTVEELKMKREIALSHMDKVLDIEKDANDSAGDSQGILISYTRGFKNGLAAISHHAILKRKL